VCSSDLPDGRSIVWDLCSAGMFRGNENAVIQESKPLDMRFGIDTVLNQEYIDSVTELMRLTRTNLGASDRDVNFGNIAANYLVVGENNAAAEMAQESLEIDPYNNAIRHFNLGFAALRLGDTERAGKVFSRAFQIARMGVRQAGIPGSFMMQAFGGSVSAVMVEPPEIGESSNEGVENVIQSSVGVFIDNLPVSEANDNGYLISQLIEAVESDFVEAFDWLSEEFHYIPYELIGIFRFLRGEWELAIAALSRVSEDELSMSGAIALSMSRRESLKPEDREPLHSMEELYQQLGGERRRAIVVDELRRQVFARMMELYDESVSTSAVSEWYATFCVTHGMTLFARREYARNLPDIEQMGLESQLAWILCNAESNAAIARKTLDSLDLSNLIRFSRIEGGDSELSANQDRRETLAWSLFEKVSRALGISGYEVDRLLSRRGNELGDNLSP